MFPNLTQNERAMVGNFVESATQTSKAMDKIAESILLFKKALVHSLAMVAMVMGPSQRQQVPSTLQASQMQMFRSQPSSSYQSLLQTLNISYSTQYSFYCNIASTTLQETGEKYQNL